MADSTHPAALPEERLLERVRIERTRGSGPGGQHRNKVSTGARLTDGPSGLVARADERRSFEDNRRVGLQRLRMTLAMELRVPWPEGREPSELWRRRTGAGRLGVNPSHPDAAALLAELLDALAVDDDPAAAAARLGVSTSRSIKVLKLEPEALRACNRRWAAAGKSTYR
jgi:hypothetical protein